SPATTLLATNSPPTRPISFDIVMKSPYPHGPCAKEVGPAARLGGGLKARQETPRTKALSLRSLTAQPSHGVVVGRRFPGRRILIPSSSIRRRCLSPVKRGSLGQGALGVCGLSRAGSPLLRSR